MAKKPIQLALTMSTALNFKYHCHTVVNTKKFHDEKAERLVTLYSVSDSFRTKDGEYITKKLYQTTSSVYLCYFLQELLYAFDGKEVESEFKEGYYKSRSGKGADDSIKYMLSLYQDDK